MRKRARWSSLAAFLRAFAVLMLAGGVVGGCAPANPPSIRAAPTTPTATASPSATYRPVAQVAVRGAPPATPTFTPRPPLDTLGLQPGWAAQLVAREPAGRVSDLAFSPSGQLLAVAAVGSPVRLWDVTTNWMVQELALGGDAVAFSADGRLLATAAEDMIHLIEPLMPGDGLQIRAGFAVEEVAFTSEAHLVGAGSENFAIWDAQTGEIIARQELPATRATRISHRGDRVLAYVYPATVDVYETTQGYYLYSLDVPPADSNPLMAISPDLSEIAYLVYVPTEYEVQFRDFQSGDLLRRFVPNIDGAVAAYTSDGRILAIGGRGGFLLVSPLANYVFAEERSTGRVGAIAINGDGTLVAAGLDSGAVRLWGAVPEATPTPLPTSTVAPPALQRAALDSVPPVRISLPLDLRTPSTTTVSRLQVLERLHVASGGAFRAFANSAHAILTTRLTAPLADLPLVGDQGCAEEVSLHQVLDLASGSTLASFQVTGWPQVWDRPGERLVAACRTSEGTRFQVIDAHGAEVGSLVVEPSDYDGGGFQISDGAGRIAFQPREGRGPALVVWSLEEGARLLEIQGGQGMVLSGDGRSVFVFEGWNVDVFLRDGRHFFYDHQGGWPYVLRLDVPSGAPSWLQTEGIAHLVRSPTFIVEGPPGMLALGPEAGLWNLTLETGFVPASQPTVDAAAFSPDGALVVFAQEAGSRTTLYVFTGDGRHRATLRVEGARGRGVGFCLDGQAIWVGSSEVVFLGLPGE